MEKLLRNLCRASTFVFTANLSAIYTKGLMNDGNNSFFVLGVLGVLIYMCSTYGWKDN
jgi:hypothetical protein